MKKIVRLTESDLARIVKRIISEAARPEPIVQYVDAIQIPFKEGGSGKEFSQQQIDSWIKQIQAVVKQNISVIGYFLDRRDSGFRLPQFIQYTIGTSSTGDDRVNSRVARERETFINNILRKALSVMDSSGRALDEEQIQKYITNAQGEYNPTELAKGMSRKRSIPDPNERMGYIVFQAYDVEGLDTGGIQRASDQMASGEGSYFLGLGDYDPQKILNGLRGLRTFSDIQDLNQELRQRGGLEEYLNDQLETGADVEYWKKEAVKAINFASNKSQRGNVAFYKNGKIVIVNI
jgi:hypothetical protein